MEKLIRIKALLLSQRAVASALLALLIFISASGPVLAQTVLQGYGSDEVLQKDDPTKVTAATNETIKDLKGVVANSNDSPVTLSAEGQKVFVATVGPYDVLVSNENGEIKEGDYISASSLAGIGMKATETQETIIGRAVKGFQGGGDSIGKGTTKDNRTVTFGRITVDIGVGKNPGLKLPDKDRVPDALQKVANTVADKSVSTLRIYLAMLVMIITALVAGITLFSGVRSAVISIGRNPLSKGIIFRGLFQVLLLSLIIFITGLFGVYLLIKL
jgi:hypothetical protein